MASCEAFLFAISEAAASGSAACQKGHQALVCSATGRRRTLKNAIWILRFRHSLLLPAVVA